MSDDANEVLPGDYERDHALRLLATAEAERDEARAQLARAREAVKRWRGGVSDAVLDDIEGALSTLPSPVSETGTGMEPGQQCTRPDGHREWADGGHEFIEELDARWPLRRNTRRCPYVEPPKGTP